MGAITLYPGKGKCSACGGAGWTIADNGKHKICGRCRGTGKALPKKLPKKSTCHRCNGTGEYAEYVLPEVRSQSYFRCNPAGKHATYSFENPRKNPKLMDRHGLRLKNTGAYAARSSCPECGGTGKI